MYRKNRCPWSFRNRRRTASKPVKTYTDYMSDKLLDLAGRDRRVVTVTAAMAYGTGLNRFDAQYPYRCFDVGIAEQHAVGFAAGLAKGGLKPYVCIYSTFLQRAYDQLVHDVCLQDLPVTDPLHAYVMKHLVIKTMKKTGIY